MARGLAAAQGAPAFGWLPFQPMWDDIVDSGPGLFD